MDGWQYLAYLAVKASLDDLHASTNRHTPSRRDERRSRRRRARHSEDS